MWVIELVAMYGFLGGLPTCLIIAVYKDKGNEHDMGL